MKTFVHLLLVLLAPVAAQAAENSHALVRAMRSDEIAVASVKRAFLSGALEDKFGKTSAGCVKNELPSAERTRLPQSVRGSSPAVADSASQEAGFTLETGLPLPASRIVNPMSTMSPARSTRSAAAASRTATSKVVRVRSDGFSNSMATWRPSSTRGAAAFVPSRRSAFCDVHALRRAR